MNCLLCLEAIENYQNLIYFNSSEWQQLNIQFIIEKHLWKMDILNSQSHVCQLCWHELKNFHKFYAKVKKAHANLNDSAGIEDLFGGVIEIENNEKADDEVCNNQKEIEPEILFPVFENEDDEEIRCARTNAKSKYPRRKSANGKQKIVKSSPGKETNEETIDIERNELGSNENSNDIEPKLLDESIKNMTEEENKIKSDINQDQVCSNFKLVTKKNSEKVNEMEENRIDQIDSFENEDDTASQMIYSSKFNQLPDEDDKFIADHFQITCTLCQTPFATYAIMLKHYRDEHKQRGYASCCSRKFYPRIELIDHIKLHRNPEYFKCEYCDKILTRSANLKTHIQKVHEENNVVCGICNKVLKKSSLKWHMSLHVTDDDKKLPCKQCGKTFFPKAALNRHIKLVHLKKHQICDICGKSIPKNRFRRHISEHEGNAPPRSVKCETCGRYLSDMGCLRRHIISLHPPEGVASEFNCSECPKVFKSLCNLKKHIRIVHENKYVRKCSLCEKVFKGPGSLKDHMSWHFGKPVIACDFCPRVFYSNGNMYTHRKTQHAIEWQASLKELRFGNAIEKDGFKAPEDQ